MLCQQRSKPPRVDTLRTSSEEPCLQAAGRLARCPALHQSRNTTAGPTGATCAYKQSWYTATFIDLHCANHYGIDRCEVVNFQ